MLATLDVIHLFANKLACLCCGSFAFSLVFASAFERAFFGHLISLES